MVSRDATPNIVILKDNYSSRHMAYPGLICNIRFFIISYIYSLRSSRYLPTPQIFPNINFQNPKYHPYHGISPP